MLDRTTGCELARNSRSVMSIEGRELRRGLAGAHLSSSSIRRKLGDAAEDPTYIRPYLHLHPVPRRLPDAEGGDAGAVGGMTITITNGDRRMPHPDLAVVTGAFSYTGRYIARRLLDQGVRVRTLARSPDRGDSFGGRVEVAPLDFSDPDGFDAGSGRLLQHLLDTVRTGPDHLRPRGREYQNAVRGC